jgi:hypothetical protein
MIPMFKVFRSKNIVKLLNKEIELKSMRDFSNDPKLKATSYLFKNFSSTKKNI